MKLNEEAILTRANEIYTDRKRANGCCTKDELLPIQSDQVKALLAALVEALNTQDE